MYIHIYVNIWKDIHQTDIGYLGDRRFVYGVKENAHLLLYTFLYYLIFINNECILFQTQLKKEKRHIASLKRASFLHIKIITAHARLWGKLESSRWISISFDFDSSNSNL